MMPLDLSIGLGIASTKGGGWWTQYGAPSMALDFANSRFMVGGAPASISALTFTRASVGYAKNLAGAWVSFSSNVPRITDRGVLIEKSVVNRFLNSGAPVTQTINLPSTGSYTIWMEGTGSAAIAANTATGSGFGTATAGSHVTVTITGAGTVDVTITGSPTHVQLENSGYPTSKIDTAGTAVTRAADVLYRVLGAEFNASAFSAIARFNRPYATSNLGQGIIGFTTNPESTTEEVRLSARNLSSNFSFQVLSSTTNTYTPVDAGTEAGVGVSQNVGFALAANDGALYNGGAQISTDATLTIPSSQAFLTIGEQRNSAGWLDGYIERVLLYRSRLSNSEMALRTT